MALRLEERPDHTPARLGIFVDTEEKPVALIQPCANIFPGLIPGPNGRAAPFTPAKETDPWHK